MNVKKKWRILLKLVRPRQGSVDLPAASRVKCGHYSDQAKKWIRDHSRLDSL